MATWSKTQRVCATCRYWMGRRDIKHTASFYQAIDSRGKCANPRGGFRRAEMNGGASCKDWATFDGVGR
jgi:hypothetical protein